MGIWGTSISSLLPIMFIFSSLISLVGVLLGVAFFTLMERKIMGLMHYRKGPNKVILSGISQPISDAIKLLSKEFYKMSFSKMTMFSMGPVVAMMIMVLMWGVYEPYFSNMSKSSTTILVIIALMSLSPYMFFLMGWGSNTKYALMGSLRAIAQVISYEVCLVLLILSIIYLTGSYKMFKIMGTQMGMWMCMINVPLFLCWMMMCMAESNRTPFDHAESESELVSGFNVEYGGGLFAVIFISEYGMIMFLSFLSSIIFLGSGMTLLKTMVLCGIFIWVRCSFPRVRYDKLMMLSWKLCLPYSLALLAFYI
uniref:NADH-ubiquinone oxidoreductase chain 1 n=1 Tax=Histiostomatidae sp. XFX TaxID=2652661 RepID=A0A5J6VC06_9ACAR|nr:NADH dehydrogenase subunit 1 [Histiostomatidae sp. XFX]